MCVCIYIFSVYIYIHTYTYSTIAFGARPVPSGNLEMAWRCLGISIVRFKKKKVLKVSALVHMPYKISSLLGAFFAYVL
jgi:hypothetical protein